MYKHLVITHEQADFDAVASSLAACLLNPNAVAVMPRRMNRNVRSFVRLYGEELPFVDYKDLQRYPLKSITLVDTQSLPSIKGLSAKTHIHVIDHHPPDSSLNPRWTKHIEVIGAATTLLVEAMQEVGTELDLVKATMLLLGIYEDTGSLSYPGTTPRDIRACAWLVEKGANLSIASGFLNPPLSDEQRGLYNQLIEGIETHQFYGLTVVISEAHAKGSVDEISTVVHKLRDVLDPAGLFVLVALNGNVQLVARSGSDSVDVSVIAEHFKGGGHKRAAAALIRNHSLKEVHQELVQLLPTFIRPLRTVGEIMSRGPQLLNPGVTIAEAAKRMQQSGHEGYPVVDDGHVIGLITRHAIDRAMTHKMADQPISIVMEAGEQIVLATDSIQHLQRMMMRAGWGQVPVADPISGEIIGIVTRTDLLNTLAEDTAPEKRKTDLADRLNQTLPPHRMMLLKLVARQAENQDASLYIVGGFVRDLLLQTPVVDFDLVVEGDAIMLAKALAEAYGGKVSSHKRFGTAKWRLDFGHKDLRRAIGATESEIVNLPFSLDFVSARAEFYSHPTALPSVKSGSIKLDLHRRDFTINTLALRLDGRYYGEILDHWGGGNDLRDGIIRVLHSLSFIDDPTRMLRAIRLEQRLGFQIEPRTLELINQAIPLLDRVSGERIHHEIQAILGEDNLPLIMARLDELGVLSAIHSTLKWDQQLKSSIQKTKDFHLPASWRLLSLPSLEFLLMAVGLSYLSYADVRDICKRLHLPAGMQKEILQANQVACEIRDWLMPMKPSCVVARLDECNESAVVAAGIILEDQPERQRLIDRYLAQWRWIKPNTTGEHLRALELAPGPIYREILWALRAAWLDDQISSAEQEEMLLKRLVSEARRDDE